MSEDNLRAGLEVALTPELLADLTPVADEPALTYAEIASKLSAAIWPLIESALAQAHARAITAERFRAEDGYSHINEAWAWEQELKALRAEVARLTAALAQAHATIERMAVDAEAHHVVLAEAQDKCRILQAAVDLLRA